MYPAYLQRLMLSGCLLMQVIYMCDRAWETNALRVTSGALSTSSRSVSRDTLHKINVSLLNQGRQMKLKMAVSLNQYLNQEGPTENFHFPLNGLRLGETHANKLNEKTLASFASMSAKKLLILPN